MTGYLTANDTPGEHAKSWYAATAGEIPERAALTGETRADVCIIGGGYAGLSAALHLAERGAEVVLLEANRAGWGASGRNGGQLGIGPRADMADYERAVGRDDARKVWEISLAANRLVRDLIARHGIECDLRDGHIEAAAKPSHAAETMGWAEWIATRYDHDTVRPLDRGELADLLGTDVYHGGCEDRMGAHLHPLKLSLGLARAAEAAGARIAERSRVTRITPGRVEATEGTVTADHILCAMNGYIDGLEPRVAARTIPINNFIIATEPIPPGDPILPGGHCVSDTLFVLNYFRLSPDRRLLWGGGESYGRLFPRDIEGLVRAAMGRIYPRFAEIGVTHAWGGTLGISAPRMPVFQSFEGGIWAISGWSGSGVHMATMGGKLAADAILGESAGFDVMRRLPVPPFPGGAWFRAPLVAAAMTWYALRDRL